MMGVRGHWPLAAAEARALKEGVQRDGRALERTALVLEAEMRQVREALRWAEQAAEDRTAKERAEREQKRREEARREAEREADARRAEERAEDERKANERAAAEEAQLV